MLSLFQFLKQCDRVLFLKDGRLVEQGNRMNLLLVPLNSII
jgi:ABC-type multidrug transport system fused ATPase/permease subunit